MDGGPLVQLLVRLARVAWGRPRLVLLGALLATLGSLTYLHDLKVDASFMGILDDGDPVAERLVDYSTRFGAASGVVLVIEGGTETERREVATAVSEALLPLPDVVDVRARVDRDEILRHGLVQLPDADFEEFHDGLVELRPILLALEVDPTLESGLGAVSARLGEGFNARSAPAGAEDALDALAVLLESLVADPDGLEDIWMAGLSDGADVGGLPLRDGWFASPDGALGFVDVQTTLRPLEVDLGLEGFGAIEAAIDPIREAHPDMWMQFCGIIPGGYQDQQNVLGRIAPLSALSLVLVLAALFLLDRRISTPLLVGAGLLVTLVWTFAAVKFCFGYASLTSLAFPTFLFGLGVDYAVHVVVRYNDERALGLDGEEAMVTALSRTGRGVVIGAVTTMTAFLMMVLTDFKAATHLGVTAAIGLGCALFVMVGVLPAALCLTDRFHVKRPRVTMELKSLSRLVAGCLRHPVRVIVVSLVVLAATASQLPRFELETDLEKIITQDIPAMRANHLFAEALGGSAEAVLSVSGSMEESRARAAQFVALDTVSRVAGPFDLLPRDVEARLDRNRRLLPLLADLRLEVPERDAVDTASLREELEALRAIGARITGEAGVAGRPGLAAKGRRVKAAATEALGSLDGREAELARTEIVLLGGLVEAVEGLRAGSAYWRYGVEDLPEELRRRFVDGDAYLTYVYPSDYRIEFEFLQRFKADVLEVDPLATGTLLVVDDLLVGGIDRLPMSLGFTVLALGAILALDLRSPRKVLVALVPVVLGSFVAIGLIIALSIPISILMLASFPIVFGIGIDDGVHILHRWEEGGEDVSAAIAATGRAILFTSLTTSLGFSVLFLLNHRGLAGLASLVVLGVGTCFVTSVTLLPVLARWASSR